MSLKIDQLGIIITAMLPRRDGVKWLEKYKEGPVLEAAQDKWASSLCSKGGIVHNAILQNETLHSAILEEAIIEDINYNKDIPTRQYN